MSLELLGAFLLFALITSITPGPNNLMLLASGANFGIRRTIPHVLGIACGLMAMVVVAGTGLVSAFAAFPVVYDVLKAISIAYLGYLAWKIATSGTTRSSGSDQKPFTWLQAALFQWVNPKTWAMVLTAVSVYAPAPSLEWVVVIALLFGSINMPSCSCWILLGQQIRPMLSNRTRVRAFNYGMAALLLMSVLQVADA